MSEKDFLRILRKTRDLGSTRPVRNGIVRAIFGEQMSHDLSLGFPLFTTKLVAFEVVKAELLWFLDAGKETGGRLDIKKLNRLLGRADDAPNIWSLNQGEFAGRGKALFEGDCGRIYGAQWRAWRKADGGTVDQLKETINNLRADPYSRRHIVTAWNPGELDDMCLPPCHMKFQFFVREEGGVKYLDLSMDQRSVDLFLGKPFNDASYALLLHMVAQCVGMLPGKVTFFLEDCHIYIAGFDKEGSPDYSKSHQEAVETQLSREPFPLPTLWLNPDVKDIDRFTMEGIKVLNYEHHGKITAPLL